MRKLLSLAVISLMFLSGSVAASDNSNSTQYSVLSDATDRIEGVVTALIKPRVNSRELECLARNIFYESGSEPREGKIAVGMVTINRSQDDKFPNTICGVVQQKTNLEVPKLVKTTYTVKEAWYKAPVEKTETQTIWKTITVCQFSWSCMRVQKPKSTDERWVESQAVAEELLTGGYDDYQDKYGNLKYFHARFLRPGWHNLRKMVTIGGHIFYAER